MNLVPASDQGDGDLWSLVPSLAGHSTLSLGGRTWYQVYHLVADKAFEWSEATVVHLEKGKHHPFLPDLLYGTCEQESPSTLPGPYQDIQKDPVLCWLCDVLIQRFSKEKLNFRSQSTGKL